MTRISLLYLAWVFIISLISWFLWWQITRSSLFTGLRIGDFMSYWAGFNEYFMRAAGVGLVVLMVISFAHKIEKSTNKKPSQSNEETK